jgi:hypothetical protein
MRGLSRANLFYMRAFAEAYPDREFVQQIAAQLTWFHNIATLTKVRDPSEREWYLRVGAAAEYRLAQALPAELRSALPSVKELEAEPAKFDERNLPEEGYGR